MSSPSFLSCAVVTSLLLEWRPGAAAWLLLFDFLFWYVVFCCEKQNNSINYVRCYMIGRLGLDSFEEGFMKINYSNRTVGSSVFFIIINCLIQPDNGELS